MPTPDGLNITTLHGKFVEPNSAGSPLSGTLTFTPSPAVITFPDENVIVMGTETVILDSNGEFTIDLISTDQTDENPMGWTYSVTEKLVKAKPRSYLIALPFANGQTVELADLTPTDNAPTYIPVMGPVGAPGLITTINGHSAATVNLVASDVGALATTARGTANGVASLDAGSKVPSTQIPDLSASYIAVGRIGAANGVAGLSAGGLVTPSQLDLSTVIGSAIANAGTVGVATSLARSDHTHAGVALTGTQTVAGNKNFTGVTQTTQLGVGVAASTARLEVLSVVDETIIQASNTTVTGTKSLFNAVGFDNSISAYSARVSGDTSPRVAVKTSGNIEFGPGNAARDSTLYRSATAVLNSTGQFAADAVAPAAASHLTRKDYVDNNFLALTGAQTVAGIKTFNASPVVPLTPTTTTQASSKGYVDTTFTNVWNGSLGVYNVRAAPYNAVGNGVADDSAAIQSALDACHAAGGGMVIIPAGKTYALSVALVVYDRTVIWAYGATMLAIGNNGLLHNYILTDTPTLYNGPSNISVYGGIWDGNGGTGALQTSGEHDVISFNHCKNITCRDLVVRNTSTAHALEFNAVNGGQAINCRFEGFTDLSVGAVRGFSEAIQVDIAVSGSSAIGAFDNTACKNILIQGCYSGPSTTYGSFGKLVGSHTAATGVVYENIQVVNNTVDGSLDIGIRAFAWQNSEIRGNYIKNPTSYGISAEVSGTTATHGVRILENIVEGGSASGILVLGASGATMTEVDISLNSVKNCSGAGISVSYADRPTINGNTVSSSGSTGIFLTLGTEGVIANNVVQNTGSNGINITSQNGVSVQGNAVIAPATNYNIQVNTGNDVSIVDNYITTPAVNKACINLTASANNCHIANNQIRANGVAAYAVRSSVTNGQNNYFLRNNCRGFGNTAIFYGTSGPTSGFVWNTGSSGTPAGTVVLTFTDTANTGSNIV